MKLSALDSKTETGTKCRFVFGGCCFEICIKSSWVLFWWWKAGAEIWRDPNNGIVLLPLERVTWHHAPAHRGDRWSRIASLLHVADDFGHISFPWFSGHITDIQMHWKENQKSKVYNVTLLVILDFGKWIYIRTNEAQTFNKTMGKHVLFLFAAQQKGNILAHLLKIPLKVKSISSWTPKIPTL